MWSGIDIFSPDSTLYHYIINFQISFQVIIFENFWYFIYNKNKQYTVEH